MIVPVLSFFTGGGFLDIGCELGGFKIVWTNERKPAFVRMYEKGMSTLRRSQRKKPFIARITNQNSIVDLRTATIRREAFGDQRPDLYGVIGGPPCPDF